MPTQRLLVPVANPETADRLLNTAIDVARDRDLEILVLHVVEVPMQLSLEQARDQLDVTDGEDVVNYALEQARAAEVASTGRIRFGRDIATSIRNVASKDNVETILLGWRGRPRRRDIVLGSYIDEILADSPCDVLVKRIDRDGSEVNSILVPVAGGPHTEYAATIAGSLARAHDARIELVTVLPERRDEDELDEARDMLTRTSRKLGGVDSVEETVLRGSDIVDTICERSTRHDVTVLGAARGGVLRRALVGNIPEAVGRGADGAVIMAKKQQGVSGALWHRIRNVFR